MATPRISCRFWLLTALFPALLCLSARAAIVAEPFPPAHLTSLYIERNVKGTTTAIRTAGDAVVYKVSQGATVIEEATVHPSGDDWFQFIQGLNGAKVYQWADKYYYPGQGQTWVIDIVMADRKFNSEGTNEFPKEGDVTQPQANPASGPSVPFQLFWQAALKLVGKAPAGSAK